MLREFPTTKFLLVGSGWGELGEKYRDEIKQLVREMHLESNVFVIGYREDANRILAASDIAVQPSLNENLGGTLESMLLGRPTVATRVGGLVDSVKDGETGVLVNPSDPKDLARGIMELLRDRSKAAALGNAGRRWMLERFTLARTVADLNSLYIKLIENRAQQRKPYNLLISVGRLMVSVPLFLYITVRLFFVDGYLWYKLAGVTPNLLRKNGLRAWLKRILLPTEV